jgi:hypothetical protein
MNVYKIGCWCFNWTQTAQNKIWGRDSLITEINFWMYIHTNTGVKKILHNYCILLPICLEKILLWWSSGCDTVGSCRWLPVFEGRYRLHLQGEDGLVIGYQRFGITCCYHLQGKIEVIHSYRTIRYKLRRPPSTSPPWHLQVSRQLESCSISQLSQLRNST